MDHCSSQVYADLVQWITEPPNNGIIHENIELRGKGANRGLFACHRILQGETLVCIPASLVLSGVESNKNTSGIEVIKSDTG